MSPSLWDFHWSPHILAKSVTQSGWGPCSILHGAQHQPKLASTGIWVFLNLWVRLSCGFWIGGVSLIVVVCFVVLCLYVLVQCFVWSLQRRQICIYPWKEMMGKANTTWHLSNFSSFINRAQKNYFRAHQKRNCRENPKGQH